MADSLAPGGLAINQLLKLKAKGLISTQQFLEMTADLAKDRWRSDPLTSRRGVSELATIGIY